MPFGMIGDIVGSGISSASNIHMANKNTEFQRHMSNTAHQRQVADMRAAGLNPMLSATGGKGASSPTGTPGHMENPNIGGAVTGYRQRKQIKAQTMQLENQEKISSAAAAKAKHQKDALTGEFGSAFTKYEMLVDAKVDPKLAAIMSGLNEIYTKPEQTKETAKKVAAMPYNRLKGELGSAYEYSGARSMVDAIKKAHAAEKKKHKKSGVPYSTYNPYKY